MYYLIIFSVLVFLSGFFSGYLLAGDKKQIHLVDTFCTFLRVYGLTWKEIEEESYDINELQVSYLINRFKYFLAITLEDKNTLRQIKEDLRKEGR